MERPSIPLRPKLQTAVALDYPGASEILVSFPDKWELVQVLAREPASNPIYIASSPPSQERRSRDHFYGLSAEINLSLNRYRLQVFRALADA